jgi:RNA polymerase sigma factor (sigma-70 family)
MTSLEPDSVDLRQMDSIRLVQLCAAHQQNSELWTEFIRRFTPKIKSFIRLSLRQYKTGRSGTFNSAASFDSNQEADLFQNIILRLVQNDCAALKRFSGTQESELMVYFAVVARTTIRDLIRFQSAKRRFKWSSSPTVQYSESDQDFEYIKEPGIDTPIEREILAREIKEITFESIKNSSGEPERDRLIFQLYFYEGLSAAQIASCKGTGVSKTGVEKIIGRFKEKVRKAANIHPFEARS